MSKLLYTKRSTPIPRPLFIENIAKPIMRKVAANQMKKNLGLALIAVCGGINFLPINDAYTGKTNPLQTLSSHLSHFKAQPNNLEPDNTPLEETLINVIPVINEKYNVPPKVIQRFIELCEQYNIDHNIFTTNGGNIKLSYDLLKVVSLFASDKGVNKENEIWGEIKPIIHIDKRLAI